MIDPKLYRSGTGRVLYKRMLVDGITDQLKILYPWCMPSPNLLLVCFEQNLNQPHCLQCGLALDKPLKKYCSTRCQANHQNFGGRNKGKPKNYTIWNKGKDCKAIHISRTNPELWEIAKKKISIGKMGDKNPMYGKRHTEEYKQALSRSMKQKILDGKFTPNSNNRLTHYDCNYNGVKYRSSWEAAFAYLNPSCKHEKLRIKYIDENGVDRIYITDFYDELNKVCYEIRPSNLFDPSSNKIKSAMQYCLDHNITYIHIDESYFIQHKDDIIMSDLSEDIRRKLNRAIN